jgi:hypothetical protein
VVALAGLLLVMATVVRAGIEGQRPDTGWLATGFVAGFIAYLLAGLFQNSLWDRYVWLHGAVVLWLHARPSPASDSGAGVDDQLATSSDRYGRGRP